MSWLPRWLGHGRRYHLNARYLESLDCDRLLHNFRKNAVRLSTGALEFHLGGPAPGEGYDLLPFHRIAHGYSNLYWRLG